MADGISAELLITSLNDLEGKISDANGKLFDKLFEKIDALKDFIAKIEVAQGDIDRRVAGLEDKHRGCTFQSHETQALLDFIDDHKEDLLAIVKKHVDHEKTMNTVKTKFTEGLAAKIVPAIFWLLTVLGTGTLTVAATQFLPKIHVEFGGKTTTTTIAGGGR